jgi:hypothetical protein
MRPRSWAGRQRRAAEHAAHCLAFARRFLDCLLDQPEIKQLGDVEDAAPFGRENVGRLDVPMNQADGMGFLERSAHLAQKIHDAACNCLKKNCTRNRGALQS